MLLRCQLLLRLTAEIITKCSDSLVWISHLGLSQTDRQQQLLPEAVFAFWQSLKTDVNTTKLETTKTLLQLLTSVDDQPESKRCSLLVPLPAIGSSNSFLDLSFLGRIRNIWRFAQEMRCSLVSDNFPPDQPSLETSQSGTSHICFRSVNTSDLSDNKIPLQCASC